MCVSRARLAESLANQAASWENQENHRCITQASILGIPVNPNHGCITWYQVASPPNHRLVFWMILQHHQVSPGIRSHTLRILTGYSES